MGDFTEGLLKLTEFPFSYSLLGLLALIFGQGVNLEDLSFEKVGPLFILMGFVATTLSICDPIGALQRFKLLWQHDLIWFKDSAAFLLRAKVWDSKNLMKIFSAPYLFAIAYSPEDIKKWAKSPVDWRIVEQAHFAKKMFSPVSGMDIPDHPIFQGTDFREEYRKWLDMREKASEANRELDEQFVYELDKIGYSHLKDMGVWLDQLKAQAVKTKWLSLEIDRISALIYFMIIISVFIIAVVAIPNLLPKFAESFGYKESVDSGIWIYLHPINFGILAFSAVALMGVIYMLRLRLRALENKGLTVFKYLTALGAIKIDKEKFDPTLNNIERYLNDTHWTLAEYWVNRIQIDYSDLFLEKVRALESINVAQIADTKEKKTKNKNSSRMK